MKALSDGRGMEHLTLPSPKASDKTKEMYTWKTGDLRASAWIITDLFHQQMFVEHLWHARYSEDTEVDKLDTVLALLELSFPWRAHTRHEQLQELQASDGVMSLGPLMATDCHHTLNDVTAPLLSVLSSPQRSSEALQLFWLQIPLSLLRAVGPLLHQQQPYPHT